MNTTVFVSVAVFSITALAGWPIAAAIINALVLIIILEVKL